MKINLKKWSRFLAVLVTILTIATMLTPAVLASPPQQDGPCNTCPNKDCALQVNIILPADGTQVYEGDTFWVNASVARPWGVALVEGVTATLVITSSDPDGTEATAEIISEDATQGPVALDNCNQVADFWWQVRCTDVGGVTLTVNAASTTTKPESCGTGTFAGTASSKVVQIERPCDPCLVVEIIECNSPVAIGSNNVVKALIHNVCATAIDGVVATVSLKPPTGQAHLTSAASVPVGTILPGRAAEAAFSYQCDAGGDVVFTVNATFAGQDPDELCHVKSASCKVHQICPAIPKVTVSGIPDKICAASDCSTFTVTAHICESCGDTNLTNVFATLKLTGEGIILPGGEKENIQTVCPLIPAGTCATPDVSWTVKCTGPGDLKVEVTVKGTDAKSGKEVTASAPAKTVIQLPTLMVNVTAPAANAKFNVCSLFDFTYRVTNCTGANITPVYAYLYLGEAKNVAVADADPIMDGVQAPVNVVYCPDSHLSPQVLMATQVCERLWKVEIPCLCGNCCYADVTWHLQCTGSGLGTEAADQCTWVYKDNIIGIATKSLLDCPPPPPPQPEIEPALFRVDPAIGDASSVLVEQMCKAHLSSTIQIYQGLMSDGTFEGDETIDAVAVGECFTVVASVANLGEATAKNVAVTLAYEGPAETQQDLTKTISAIGCHGAGKVTWEFCCDAAGPVDFWLAGLTGTDANTNAAIPADNIEQACPVTLCQIPLEVEIIQPLTSTDFVVGECFSVKAKITYDMIAPALACGKIDCLTAELFWTSTGPGCEGSRMKITETTPPQMNPIELGSMIPGDVKEVAWNVCCTCQGDVTFWVVVDTAENCQTGSDIDIEAAPQTIHQWEAGGIHGYIVSPDLDNYDLCWEPMMQPEGYYATGQQFAVTAKVWNGGLLDFTVTGLSLTKLPGSWGDFAILGGPTPGVPFTLASHQSKIVTWDLRCTKSGQTFIGFNVAGHDSLNIADSDSDAIYVEQYATANLVVDITAAPTGDIVTGTDFPVTVRVTNVGEADAINVNLTLSANPAGSVRVSASDPDGSYTKSVGNLTGHGVAESAVKTWILRCEAVGDTTITVAASGEDEYGYQVKQVCTSKFVGPMQITCCNLTLDGQNNLPIAFTTPDSATVRQVGSGGSGGGGGGGSTAGTINVALAAGWNLVSMPYFIEPANRAPATLLSSILDATPKPLNTAYAYLASTSTWSTYATSGPAGTLTSMRDGPGYWFYMNAADTLVVSGDLAPTPPDLPPSYSITTAGWNLIGFKNGAATKTAGAYLTGTSFAVIYGYTNGSGYYQVQSTDLLQPGKGYWVAFLAPGTIYP